MIPCNAARPFASACLVVALVVASVSARAAEDGWAHYGGSLAGDRYAAPSAITPKSVEHLSRLGSKPVEEVALFSLQALGPLAAGPERRVVGEMAQQVERIRLGLADIIGQGAEVDPPFLQPLHDLRPAFRVEPVLAEPGRVRIEGAHVVAGVVGEMA